MVNKLRDKIKNKFGTISRFCEVAGLDRIELQKLFQAARRKITKERAQRIDELSKLCSNTDKHGNTGKDLTRDMVYKINVAVSELGGVDKFCDSNPEFSRSSLFDIVKGRRKNRSKKVNELITFLNVE